MCFTSCMPTQALAVWVHFLLTFHLITTEFPDSNGVPCGKEVRRQPPFSSRTNAEKCKCASIKKKHQSFSYLGNCHRVQTSPVWFGSVSPQTAWRNLDSKLWWCPLWLQLSPDLKYDGWNEDLTLKTIWRLVFHIFNWLLCPTYLARSSCLALLIQLCHPER